MSHAEGALHFFGGLETVNQSLLDHSSYSYLLYLSKPLCAFGIWFLPNCY